MLHLARCVSRDEPSTGEPESTDKPPCKMAIYGVILDTVQLDRSLRRSSATIVLPIGRIRGLTRLAYAANPCRQPGETLRSGEASRAVPSHIPPKLNGLN